MKKTPSLLAILLASTVMLSAPMAMAKSKTAHEMNAQNNVMPKADPLADADSDMKKVLDAQASLGPKPIETLTPAEARVQPTPADGAKLVIKQMGKDPNDSMGVITKDLTYKAGDGSMQPARIYMPADMEAGKPVPVIVYYHGGGWVIADINVYDSSPRALAKLAKAIVVSVEYRRAPENKFPAAHDDAFAAYKWVLANANGWGGDVSKVALVGESAGGNLAINTAIKARDTGTQMPVAEVLVYPVAGVNMNTKSYVEYGDAKPLNKPMMAWFVKHTIKSDKDKMDPRIDLIGKADLHGLPPTTIITAQIDPLNSDGKLLADKLGKAGVPVAIQNYDGVTHEFFGMGAVVSKAMDAEQYAASNLKDGFAKTDK